MDAAFRSESYRRSGAVTGGPGLITRNRNDDVVYRSAEPDTKRDSSRVDRFQKIHYLSTCCVIVIKARGH
jgi:hypothetical protein